MDSALQHVIHETFTASNEGRIHFGEVVGRLVEVGVSSYIVDYRCHRATYYLANDETLALEMEATPVVIGERFSCDAVLAAIRGAQRGEVMYPEFKRLSMAAGCVGYTVWISGRHVTYFGRNGETHVEQFPS